MLVSAIMPTGRLPGRRALSQVAIECFFRQTYPDRQLVIVNHSEEPFGLEDPRVKEVVVRRPPTLGELRNIGLDAADGELLITWDDDDWHHPCRMEKQAAVWNKLVRPLCSRVTPHGIFKVVRHLCAVVGRTRRGAAVARFSSRARPIVTPHKTAMKTTFSPERFSRLDA